MRVYSEVLRRYVEVPDEPERIVSLSPAHTEMLHMLGVFDRVVGVSYFCHKPREALKRPRVGSYWKVNWARLEELMPDLVLVTTGAQLRVVDELVERGFTTYPIPLPLTLYGILDSLIALGILVGRLERARRASRSFAERLSRLRGSLEGVKAYYEIDLGGPETAGPFSYIDDAFYHLGVETPFRGERATWIHDPDPETIIGFDPDVVIYELKPGLKAGVDWVKRHLERRGLGRLKAVRENRIIVLEPDTLAHYSPSIVDVMESLVEEVRRALKRPG